jgi:hypothetical protein
MTRKKPKTFTTLFNVLLLVLLVVEIVTITLPKQAASETAQPPVIVETLDPSLDRYAEMWKTEISRRFSNAVAVFVHGGNRIEGEWQVNAGLGGHASTARDIVRHFQSVYPDRTVVLISCNPGHLKLGVPGVYYAKSDVWLIPDRQTDATTNAETGTFDLPFPFPIPFVTEPETRHTRWELNPEAVGSIFEFVKE